MRRTIATFCLCFAVLAATAAGEPDTKVYVTKTGKKYHRAECESLKKSKIEIRLKDAKKKGYKPCTRCEPPT